MRALELFAGLGGLRLAAPAPVEVVAAYDQDRAAGAAYAANHPVPVVAIDLAAASARELARHEAEVWLLSPPCQPFTRRGRGGDVDDRRCAGLLRLIELLPQLRPRRLLLENVPGFHGSRAHARLVAALRSLGHETRDVRACPSELGAPVRRRREFVVSSRDGLPEGGPPGPAAGGAAAPAGGLAAYLDPAPDPALRLPPDDPRAARAATTLPLATFTRSYGHARAGAGPILRDASGTRLFSPAEILRLHAFPGGFALPDALPLRTRLRLAGNSVHVASVRAVARAIG